MSKQRIAILTLSIVATGAITAHRGVGYDDAQAAAAGQKIKGVATSDAAQGDSITVDAIGTTIIESGGAFDPGDALAIDADGRAVEASSLAVAAGATPVTSGAANGAAVLTGGILPQYVFADALQAATGAGQFVEVKLR